ncbi:MAG TPA: hypothetical protein PLT93_19220, partial [Phycisphaerae bacterium]|nr:hypothetical protein [Phycisphaerae bacterium]
MMNTHARACTWYFFLPVVVFLFGTGGSGQAQAESPVTGQMGPPANLRCEYRVNPLGIDIVRPRLSWQVQD